MGKGKCLCDSELLPFPAGETPRTISHSPHMCGDSRNTHFLKGLVIFNEDKPLVKAFLISGTDFAKYYLCEWRK